MDLPNEKTFLCISAEQTNYFMDIEYCFVRRTEDISHWAYLLDNHGTDFEEDKTFSEEKVFRVLRVNTDHLLDVNYCISTFTENLTPWKYLLREGTDKSWENTSI